MHPSNPHEPQAESFCDVPQGAVVAVVDDDKMICAALGDWLDSAGVAARTYTSAEELLNDLVESPGGARLKAGASGAPQLWGAIVDLNLPGIDGAQLARQLAQRIPGVRLAIITATNEDERVRLGAGLPGIAVIKKPFSLDALEQALVAGR